MFLAVRLAFSAVSFCLFIVSASRKWVIRRGSLAVESGLETIKVRQDCHSKQRFAMTEEPYVGQETKAKIKISKPKP